MLPTVMAGPRDKRPGAGHDLRKKIVLIQDNHNPQTGVTLRGIPRTRGTPTGGTVRVRHYTPKHGSWLDLAESELSVLSGQCLDRRIADKQTVVEEVAAWEVSRNQNHTTADWQFTTANARVKLKRLYPSL